MYCKQCGGQNTDDAKSCVFCNAPLTGDNPYQATTVTPGSPGEKVPNYLVYAILTTLCCCIPFGIVAIIYAAQVDGKAAAGDYQGALRSSQNAKMWCWIGFGVGILGYIVGVGAQIAALIAQNGNFQ